MDFYELWKIQEFRQIFLDLRIFRSDKELDEEYAEELWSDRYPNIEWGTCAQRGCNVIVPEGERCGQHSIHSHPSWVYIDGNLFHYMRIRHGHAGEMSATEYKMYPHYVLEQKYGYQINAAYLPFYADLNPLNNRKENLFLFSKYAACLLENELVDEDDAVYIDQLIADFVAEKFHRKGRPPFCGRYAFSDIARAAKVEVPTVRSAVSRDVFDPHNLSEVADYILRRRPKEQVNRRRKRKRRKR